MHDIQYEVVNNHMTNIALSIATVDFRFSPLVLWDTIIIRQNVRVSLIPMLRVQSWSYWPYTYKSTYAALAARTVKSPDSDVKSKFECNDT